MGSVLVESLLSGGGPPAAALLAVGSAGGRSWWERLTGPVAWLDAATPRRLRVATIFAALAVGLVALPGRAVDPFGVVVPREVLLFAGLILVIEAGSYVMMERLGGSRGLAVTGLLAGSANSLAAAGVLARVARRSRRTLDAASLALLLATFAMIVRNVALAVALADGLAPSLLQPALAMGGVTLLVAVLLARRGEGSDHLGVDLDSPLSVRAAGKFAVAYVAILLVSVAAESTLGGLGLFATALAGGLVSSGAVAVSAATVFESGAVPAEVATGMVVLGIAGSLCAKIALVEWVTDDLRTRASLPLSAVGVAGLAVVAVMWLL
jgi:uncharacterized membrane protein (DUF4010 family)